MLIDYEPILTSITSDKKPVKEHQKKPCRLNSHLLLRTLQSYYVVLCVIFYNRTSKLKKRKSVFFTLHLYIGAPQGTEHESKLADKILAEREKAKKIQADKPEEHDPIKSGKKL